jgi:hypothetical protein
MLVLSLNNYTLRISTRLSELDESFLELDIICDDILQLRAPIYILYRSALSFNGHVFSIIFFSLINLLLIIDYLCIYTLYHKYVIYILYLC